MGHGLDLEFSFGPMLMILLDFVSSGFCWAMALMVVFVGIWHNDSDCLYLGGKNVGGLGRHMSALGL